MQHLRSDLQGIRAEGNQSDEREQMSFMLTILNILLSILLYISIDSLEDMMAHAVKLGAAVWVVNPTNGSTTFKWNDEITAEKESK